MQKVAKNVYFTSEHLGCNVGCILTGDGPVLIDSPALPEGARAFRRQVKELTPKNIAFTIYTHEHFDHVMGSEYLTHSIVAHQTVVAEAKYLQKNLAAEISSFFPDFYRMYKDTIDTAEIIGPNLTFTGEMSFYLKDVTLQLSYAGGHSPGSIFVYLPQTRVLFCGDVADRGMPFTTPYSRFDEWIAALKRIEAMKPSVIVPGHGEVCTVADVRRIRTYFRTLCARVGKLVKAGFERDEIVTKLDLTDCLPAPDSELARQQMQRDAGLAWDWITDNAEEDEE